MASKGIIDCKQLGLDYLSMASDCRSRTRAQGQAKGRVRYGSEMIYFLGRAANISFDAAVRYADYYPVSTDASGGTGTALYRSTCLQSSQAATVRLAVSAYPLAGVLANLH